MPKKVTSKLLQDFKEHNALMRRVGSKEKSLDEYVRYITGRMRKKRSRTSNLESATYKRPSPEVPSGVGIGSAAPLKPAKHYDGARKLIGIAAMHKSNLVPVFDEADAKDISKMRRN